MNENESSENTQQSASCLASIKMCLFKGCPDDVSFCIDFTVDFMVKEIFHALSSIAQNPKTLDKTKKTNSNPILPFQWIA